MQLILGGIPAPTEMGVGGAVTGEKYKIWQKETRKVESQSLSPEAYTHLRICSCIEFF